MASLYDYGVPAMATGLTNLFNAVSQDKARQAQINSQKIEDRVRLNALKKDAEQEERLNKYINVQGLLTSQGMHPEDAKSTIEEWKSMGWVDDGPGGLPRMQVRNAESAFKHLDESPKWKMNIAQGAYLRAQNFKSQLVQEQQALLEKDPVMGHKDKKYIELQQKIDAVDKELVSRGTQIEKAKTLFGKSSEKNTIVPAGSTVLGPDNKPVFTAPQSAKPVNMPPWFDALGTSLMGSKYNTPEGQNAVSDWVADPKNKPSLEAFQRTYAANNAMPYFGVVPTSGGLQPVNSRTGQIAGPPIGDKPLTNEMITSLQQIETLKETMKAMKDVYNPKEGVKHKEWVGPVQGRYSGLKEQTVGMEEDQAMFRSRVAQLQNSLIYLMSGKQINESEYVRLKKQIPDINLPDKVFEARMNEFDRTVDSIIKNRKDNMGGYGIDGGSSTKRLPNETPEQYIARMEGK